jgi:hypothetical protein
MNAETLGFGASRFIRITIPGTAVICAGFFVLVMSSSASDGKTDATVSHAAAS